MIRKACYVACDECGTPAEITTDGAPAARSLAARDGFVRVGGQDLCSEHAPAGAEPSKPRRPKLPPGARLVNIMDVPSSTEAGGGQ